MTFRRSQEQLKSFYFERPPSASHEIPPTLVHPIFGQFVDDCENHTPTRDDNLLASELRYGMSQILETEAERVYLFLQIMRDQGIQARGSEAVVGRARTDADMEEDGHRDVIIEFKNEMASRGAELLFQARGYYRLSVDVDGLNGVKKSQLTVARHMGALKKAINALRDYNRNLRPSENSKQDISELEKCFPYETEFDLRDGWSKCHFTYESKIDGKLVYKATSDSVCVKFVRR
ncbi:hypothetical protein F5148DRAFT_1285652 [Russula earlei]|uniref:Uncharacterized protein n=1 Tax=Russula earlei TaxID=71964 RepID=A0ACC0U8B5_9AGAM|nr:hypothetical protein F5148DRAFT_1285652 [Russula earlei]